MKIPVVILISCGAAYLLFDGFLLFSLLKECRRTYDNWSGWCSRQAGTLSRVQALQWLEDALASGANYLMLQRMSAVAPLLGVITTAVGMYFLNVDTTMSDNVAGVLGAVKPLYMGVGMGAGLAIVHQLLFLPQATARHAFWKHKASEGLHERLADPVEQALSQFGSRLLFLAQSVEKRIADFSQVGDTRIRELDTNLRQLSENIEQVSGRCRDGGTSLEAAGTQFVQGMTGAGAAVARGGQLMEQQLQTWRQAVSESGGELVGATAGFRTTADELRTMIQQFSAQQAVTVENQSAARAAMQDAVQNIGAMMQELRQLTPGLAQTVRVVNSAGQAYSQASAEMTRTAGVLREGLSGMQENAQTSTRVAADVLTDLRRLLSQTETIPGVNRGNGQEQPRRKYWPFS